MINKIIKIQLVQFIAAILLSVSIFPKCSAQGELAAKDGKVYYELIDSISGSADNLFDKGKMWFADAFRDSKEVIQLADKEKHMLMGKGNFSFDHGGRSYHIWFSVKLITKDGKYRIQFYDVIVESDKGKVRKPAEYYNDRKGQGKIKNKINGGMVDIIERAQEYMRRKVDDDF